MTELWDIATWVWGDTLLSHAIAIFLLFMVIGGFRFGWVSADNAERLNRKLRADEAARPQSLR